MTTSLKKAPEVTLWGFRFVYRLDTISFLATAIRIDIGALSVINSMTNNNCNYNQIRWDVLIRDEQQIPRIQEEYINFCAPECLRVRTSKVYRACISHGILPIKKLGAVRRNNSR